MRTQTRGLERSRWYDCAKVWDYSIVTRLRVFPIVFGGSELTRLCERKENHAKLGLCHTPVRRGGEAGHLRLRRV
jgi:hypothetical protein